MKNKKKPETASQKSWFLSTLDRLAEAKPEHVLISEFTTPQDKRLRTRQRFQTQVKNIAIFLSSLGVTRNTRIIMDIDIGMKWEVFAVWCACQMLGACAVFFPPDMRYRDVKTEIDDADAHNGAPSIAIVGTPERVKKWVTTEADAAVPRMLICLRNICRDGSQLDALFEWPLPKNIIHFEKIANDTSDTPLQPALVHDDASAAFVFTQGSHQNARRVEISYAHFRAQAEDLQQYFNLSPEDGIAIDQTSPLAVCLFVFAASLYSGASFVCRSPQTEMSDLLAKAGITHAFMLPYEIEKLAILMTSPSSRLKSRWRQLCLSGGKFRTRNTRKSLKWTGKFIRTLCTNPIREAFMPDIKALISYGNHFNAKHGELLSFVDVPVFNGFTVTELGFVHLHQFTGEGSYFKSVETKVRNGLLSIKSRRSGSYICTDDLVFEDARCGLCSQRNFCVTLDSNIQVNAAPTREILRRHAIIDEIFVFGQNRPFLTALIYLNPEALQTWCANQKLPFHDFETTAQHPQVYNYIRSLVDGCNQRRGPHESIQKFAVLPRSIDQDPRILTPCRLTRPTDVERRYAALIQSLYSDNF